VACRVAAVRLLWIGVWLALCAQQNEPGLGIQAVCHVLHKLRMELWNRQTAQRKLLDRRQQFLKLSPGCGL
jgi:hypothetical protein